MNIFVIGSGTFGTAISNELSRNVNNNITIYSRSIEIVNEINSEKTNKKYFANTKLADSLKCTSKFIDIKSANVIFIALPSSAIIEVIDDFKVYISSSQLIVNLSKGIFKNGQTIVDYLNKVLENKNNFNGILDDNNNFEKTSNNEENQKVDINILKSRLKKKEDIILKRNIAILIGCLSLFVIAATYVEYL